MNNRVEQSIFVASLGGFDLTLPVLRYGAGSPKLLFVNNLHGNEITGFYVLEKLLADLPPLKGTLTIITSANPLGFLHKHRLLTLDYVDLNRGYPPPDKDRGIHVVLKEALMRLSVEHDMVVDLHTFIRPSLSAGLALRQATPEQQARLEDCLRVLGTETTVEMDVSGKEEKRTSSAYDFYVIGQGKLSFVIEYPPISQVDDEMLNRYAAGLRRMLVVSGLTDEKVTLADYPVQPRFKRQQIISRKTGLFIPVKKLWDVVGVDDVLGYILDMKNLSKEPLISPYAGVLTELATRQVYVFGEKLATIGGPVKM